MRGDYFLFLYFSIWDVLYLFSRELPFATLSKFEFTKKKNKQNFQISCNVEKGYTTEVWIARVTQGNLLSNIIRTPDFEVIVWRKLSQLPKLFIIYLFIFMDLDCEILK